MDYKSVISVLYLLLTLSSTVLNAQCNIPSLIPNSDFESQSNCPTASGQVTHASSWLQTSDFSAEYYNCGFTNIASTYNAPPLPASGTGYIGLANQSTGNKQYASACLSSGLIAGMSYTYQFDIAAANGSASSLFNGSTSDLTYTMVLYGSTSCPVPSYSGNSCPSPSDGWQIIATITVTASATEWTTHSVEFIPTTSFQSIAIGSDCNVASNSSGLCLGGLCYNYYYLDNLILNLTSLYPIVDAGVNITNDCTTPTNAINANISGGTPGFNYDWSPALGLSNANIASPVADPGATTNYIVTITDANGCIDKDTIKVLVDKTPPVASAGPDKTIDCNNPSVGLTASGGDSYSWSPSTGLSSASVPNPSSSATITTQYTVTVIGTNGCTDTDDLTVTVDKDLPNATAGPNVTTSCAVPDAQLTASGGGTYKWTPDFAIGNPNIANTWARPPTTTTYTVTVTAPNGCESTASTTVTINDPTPLAITGPNINRCGVDNATFNPDITTQLPIDTYLWSSSNSNPTVASFIDVTDPTTTASNLIEGTYKFYFSVSNNVCPPVMDSILVNVFDPTSSFAGHDDSLCSIYSTQFNADVTVGTAIGKWTLQNSFPNPNPGAVVFSDLNSPNSNVSGLEEGVYRFIWTVSNGNCYASRDTVEISVFDEPTANAGIDDSLCSLYSVNLGATIPVGTSTGLWTEELIGNPTSVTFANDISPLTNVGTMIEGVYNYIWTVSNGSCADAIDTVAVNIYDTPISNAGVALSICGEDSLNIDTLLFLNSNDPVGTSSGVWTISPNFLNPSTPIFIDDTSYVSGVTNLLEGEYRFIWTVNNGSCTAVKDSVQIIALDKPRAIVGNDQNLCAIYSTDLSARAPIGAAVGEWSIPIGWNNPSIIAIDDSFDTHSQVSGFIEGIYKFIWTVSNGNCNPATDTLTITIYDTPIADAGNDIELCAIYTTNLQGVDPVGTSSGVWTQDFLFNNNSILNFDDDTLNTTNTTGYIEGTYQLIWTVSNGVCPNDVDSVLVSIYDTPIANAGFDQYNCDLDTVLLAGGGNVGTATGEWFLNPLYPYPSIPLFRDSSLENTVADNLIVGDYALFWGVENGVCPSDTDTVIIYNMERPVAIANYSEQQCDNKCFNVSSLSTAPAGDGLIAHWIIDNEDYYDSVPEICINVADDYAVNLTVTASNGCVDSLINYPLITVNPSPTAGFQLEYETDSLLELQRVDVIDFASNDVISYLYEMGNGDSIKERPEFIYFYYNFGYYNVGQYVENQFGCRDSIYLDQEVLKRATVFIPNTFTPNADGINDEFKPVSRGLSDMLYEFTIFDRWGTMIYRTTTPNVGWDGYYKGKVAKDDAYLWKLSYAHQGSTDIIEEKGHVIIYKFSR